MAAIQDYATGKPVNDSKPEERVRQEYERTLVDAYGYRKDEIDIEVRIPRGSGYFDDRADIVIYHPGGGRDPASDILGIVETKRPDRTDGTDQLKSYMTATSAMWGVWTNEEDIAYFSRNPANAQVMENLYNIPERGQSLEDVGRARKDELRPFGREELKSSFRRILRTLYANTTISRREKLGGEMIKLIFAKIEDEMTYPNRIPAFRAEQAENPATIKTRVQELFGHVLTRLEHDGVFQPNENITLDAEGVAWVVGQIQQGSLLKTDTDVVGDAFEVFAESKFAGEKGEFFTPRGVVSLAVALADPKPEQTVCDPACGSGGFLLAAMRHIWDKMEDDPRWHGSELLRDQKREMAQSTVFGIDKETDLVKIAKAHMAIAGDGRSNIVHDNSLHHAADFTNESARHFVRDGIFRQFDYVMTNPPYGTKTKVLKRDAGHFQLGRSKSDKPMDRDPYVLFVERSLEMLQDGGTLCIVLPESVLHAPSLAYLRDFLLKNNNLRAVVSLPHNTFRPYCNAKTVLLSLEKGVPQGDIVVMADPDEMGHDEHGNPLHRPGTEEVWDDLPTVMDELAVPQSDQNKFTFAVTSQGLNPNLLVPRYYRDPPPLPDGRTGITIKELVKLKVIGHWNGHGSPRNTEKGRGEIPYIRVADVVNWELYRNPVAMVAEDVHQRLAGSSKKYRPQAYDVILVRRGSYRIGTVAMVSHRDAADRVLMTAELLALRVNHDVIRQIRRDGSHPVAELLDGFTSEYLLALLSSQYVQQQAQQYTFVDTTLPNLGDRWQKLTLPIHNDVQERRDISASTRKALRLKWQAQTRIDQLRRGFGPLTT